MNQNPLLSRISADPNVCFGNPCIRGTRIWVSLILENLAEGTSQTELMKVYPQLKADDIRAALVYGAEATRERVVSLEPVA